MGISEEAKRPTFECQSSPEIKAEKDWQSTVSCSNLEIRSQLPTALLSSETMNLCFSTINYTCIAIQRITQLVTSNRAKFGNAQRVHASNHVKNTIPLYTGQLRHMPRHAYLLHDTRVAGQGRGAVCLNQSTIEYVPISRKIGTKRIYANIMLMLVSLECSITTTSEDSFWEARVSNVYMLMMRHQH